MENLQKLLTTKNLLIVGALLVALIVASYFYSCKCGSKSEYFSNPSSGNINLKVFYADWCGHCNAAKPEFTTLEQTLTDSPTINSKTVNVQLVNEADSQPVVAEYGVKGYPTIILDQGNGYRVPYNGERKAQSIMDWIGQQI